MEEPGIGVSEVKRPALAFAEVSEQRSITLRSFALAAVGASIGDGVLPGDEGPEIQFLLSHLDPIDPGRTGWAPALYAHLSCPAPADAPLIRLLEEMELTLIEMLAVALAASVEDDVMAGRALARVQAPLGGSRPTLGLLGAALREVKFSGVGAINTLLTGVAMQSGLLKVIGEKEL